MNTNNFDLSSKGVNLMLSVYRDTEISSFLWEENFCREEGLNGASLLYPRFFNVDVFHYIHGGEYETTDLADLENYHFNKKDLKNIISEFDIAEDVKLHLNKPVSKARKAELLDAINYLICKDELQEWCLEHLPRKFEVITIRGYYKGDYAEVIVPSEYFNNTKKDREQDISALENYFKELFYDTPWSIHLKIDGEDYYLDEQLENAYNYEKDEVIEIAHRYIKHDKKDIILDFLKENLPDYCEYI